MFDLLKIWHGQELYSRQIGRWHGTCFPKSAAFENCRLSTRRQAAGEWRSSNHRLRRKWRIRHQWSEPTIPIGTALIADGNDCGWPLMPSRLAGPPVDVMEAVAERVPPVCSGRLTAGHVMHAMHRRQRLPASCREPGATFATRMSGSDPLPSPRTDPERLKIGSEACSWNGHRRSRN